MPPISPTEVTIAKLGLTRIEGRVEKSGRESSEEGGRTGGRVGRCAKKMVLGIIKGGLRGKRKDSKERKSGLHTEREPVIVRGSHVLRRPRKAVTIILRD